MNNMNNNPNSKTKKLNCKSILRSSPDLYLIIDTLFNIVEVSDRYLQATMVKRNDIIGKNIFDVFPDNPNDPEATGVKNLRESLQKVIKTKMPDAMAVQKYDIRKPIEEGSEFEVRFWSPLNTPVIINDEVKYIIHRVEDVTEFIKLKELDTQQRRIAEKLLAKTGQMELEIYRRAQEIQETNRELNLAKEKAESLIEQARADNNAKSSFLATMSHELRTSLNGVIGMTELLLDTSLSPKQMEFAETIRISGEALLMVINDVLDYSKIEAGHLKLAVLEFDLQLVLDQAIEIIIGQAYRKRIEIGAYIEPDVPKSFLGDSVRIRQVLNNLLCNAIKFTKHGEISIWVRLLQKKDNIATLLFEVNDTGEGIEPEVLEHLFQPYFQGKIAEYRGTGLGLCISKQLIEIMGGNIKVESQPGKGSQFSFTLELNINPNTKKEFVIPENHRNKRILCIDDSQINREVIKRILTNWEFRCDVIDNGAKALSLMIEAFEQNDPYAIVFVDDCMPNMNGFELIGLIRQIKEISNTIIILLCSLGFNFDKERLKALSVSSSISKPIHPTKLQHTLLKVFMNKTSSDEIMNAEQTVSANHFYSNTRILLAEDNFINQQISLRLLTKLGLEADVATTGLEAIEAYNSKSYDLILMDCQMPIMDGYSATQEIRKAEKKLKNHVPIIAMTAHALKGDREKCIQAGMDDYIAKPLNIKLLNEMMEKWLVDKMEKK